VRRLSAARNNFTITILIAISLGILRNEAFMFVPANFVILWIFIDEMVGGFPEKNISELCRIVILS